MITQTAGEAAVIYQAVNYSYRYRDRVKYSVLNVPHSNNWSKTSIVLLLNLRVQLALRTSRWQQALAMSSEMVRRRHRLWATGEGWLMMILIQIIPLVQPSKKTSMIFRMKVLTVNLGRRTLQTSKLSTFKMLISKKNHHVKSKKLNRLRQSSSHPKRNNTRASYLNFNYNLTWV